MSTEEDEKGLFPINNGLVLENYRWTQNQKDVSITIPIESNTRTKDIEIKFNPTTLNVKIKGKEIINGELFSVIKSENSTWLIDDSELVIELDKKKFDEWWDCALKGEPKIDLSKIVTEKGSLDDLDQETRMTIDKMLYDQKKKEEQGFYKH